MTLNVKEKAPFTRLEVLDRYRALCLGLPVPIWHNEQLPWGYDLDNDNPGWCKPDDKALRLLHKTVKELKHRSLRDMAQWLSAASGRKIGYTGLRNLASQRPPFEEIHLSYEERLKADGLRKTTSASKDEQTKVS